MLPLACLGIQGTETVVTVRLERAHAECLGQGQSLPIMSFGLRDLGGSGVGIDHAKLVQRVCLVPACLLLSGQVEGLTRVLPGLLAAARQTTASLSQAIRAA